MVKSNLHLICGNCGCNDNWTWQHIAQAEVQGEIINDEDVNIYCGNCATIHCLSENAELEEE